MLGKAVNEKMGWGFSEGVHKLTANVHRPLCSNPLSKKAFHSIHSHLLLINFMD